LGLDLLLHQTESVLDLLKRLELLLLAQLATMLELFKDLLGFGNIFFLLFLTKLLCLGQIAG
jgi:hypothetical protein